MAAARAYRVLFICTGNSARSILAEDARAGTSDHRRELWASGLPPTDVQLGSLAGEIRDEQGLFNLNNLLRGGKPDPLQIGALGRLLGAIGLVCRAPGARGTTRAVRSRSSNGPSRGCSGVNARIPALTQVARAVAAALVDRSASSGDVRIRRLA